MSKGAILRYAVGAILSPIGAPLALLCITTAMWTLKLGDFARAESLAAHYSSIGVLLAFATIVAYVMMIVMGLPLAALSERRGLTQYRRALHLGVGVGALPFVAYFGFLVVIEIFNGVAGGDLGQNLVRLAVGIPTAVLWLLLGVSSGFACASIFWCLVWRKPRDA